MAWPPAPGAPLTQFIQPLAEDIARVVQRGRAASAPCDHDRSRARSRSVSDSRSASAPARLQPLAKQEGEESEQVRDPTRSPSRRSSRSGVRLRPRRSDSRARDPASPASGGSSRSRSRSRRRAASPEQPVDWAQPLASETPAQWLLDFGIDQMIPCCDLGIRICIFTRS